MRATGSKLIKIAKIRNLDVCQDVDTKKLYVDVFGSLRQVDSLQDAAEFIESLNAMSKIDKEGFGID